MHPFGAQPPPIAHYREYPLPLPLVPEVFFLTSVMGNWLEAKPCRRTQATTEKQARKAPRVLHP